LRVVTSPATRPGFRSQLFDVGLVVVLLTAGLLEAFLRPSTPGEAFTRGPDLWGTVATIAIVLPLVWRRRFPIPVMVASGAAYLAALLIGYENTSAVDTTQLIVVYNVSVYATRPAADRARWLMAAAIAAGLFWAHRMGELSFTQISLMFVTWIGFAIFGETVYVRRRYQEALEERARRLEAQQDERARLAVQEERARISREFHDIWAHTLSTVVVQAGAAQEVFDESPELVRQALTRIEGAGRRALAEVRRMISSDAAAPTGGLVPLPGLADLPRLVDELGRAGVPVELAVTGEIDDLPDDIGLSTYRIVQQALTNTLSHAGAGVTARVVVRRVEGEVLIDVVDAGRGASEPSDAAHRGRGLIGMRERATLFGGDLRAGPRPEGGFAVHARIPVGAGA